MGSCFDVYLFKDTHSTLSLEETKAGYGVSYDSPSVGQTVLVLVPCEPVNTMTRHLAGPTRSGLAE